MKYLARRLLHSIAVLFGISALSFLFVGMAPGDYLDEMQLNPQLSAATIAALRAEYGMDRPLPVRYMRWLRSVAHGDWGYSFAYNLPVAPLLWRRAKNTLWLTVPATLLAWLLAVPLGVFAAKRRGRWSDRMAEAGTSTILVVPDLLLALVLLIFAARTRAFPAGGMSSFYSVQSGAIANIQDFLRHLTLPTLTLALGILPVFFRHVRAGMVEALASPSIEAARALGLSPSRILFSHALRLAANPVLSLFGLSIATLLSSSLLVEVVMSWPGLGPMLLEAILGRDLYLVIGAIMFSTLFLMAGNLAADLLLYAVDPRIRTGASR
jgi:peptide/nickel transport system permease protein